MDGDPELNEVKQYALELRRINSLVSDMTSESFDCAELIIDLWDPLHRSLPIEEVPISAIKNSYSPRVEGVGNSHVSILAQSPTPLPPIVIHRSTMHVIDGMHRLRAAQLRGATVISARLFDGTEDDAFMLAVHLNVTHGLPLRLADRKAAAERLLSSNPQWSDRSIARIVGVSHRTIAKVRHRAIANDAPSLSRLGRDGKAHPVSTVDGRRRAAEIAIANPTASLRQIARAAGVSVGTAHDVRSRIGRGECALPDRVAQSVEAGRLSETAKDRNTATTARDSFGKSLPAASDNKHAVAIFEPFKHAAVLLQKLRKDPALKFSEAGRTLIRHLSAAYSTISECNALVETAPDHSKFTIAQLATTNARAWEELAGRLQRTEDEIRSPRT
ncbi:hypothetical protein [Mycobacterium haemophilum]